MLEKSMIAELVKTRFVVGFTLGGNRILTEDAKMIGIGGDHERTRRRCTSVACGAMEISCGWLRRCRLRLRGCGRRGSSASENMRG